MIKIEKKLPTIKVLLIIAAVCQYETLLSTPSSDIPSYLYDAYTLHGAIPVSYWYIDGTYSDSNPLVYSTHQIELFISNALQKKVGYYGETDTYLYQALEKYGHYVRNKSTAILGSTVPWYESIMLAYGSMPTTIEYNKIISQDARLKVMTVDEYNKNPQLFDAIISISSFEHDGLGRYGDPLNPIGDIEAMKKAKSMLKKDGLLFLSVPIGQDNLVWNAHRIYGKLRFSLLIDGWELIESFGFKEQDLQDSSSGGGHQPIFVLRPK